MEDFDYNTSHQQWLNDLKQFYAQRDPEVFKKFESCITFMPGCEEPTITDIPAGLNEEFKYFEAILYEFLLRHPIQTIPAEYSEKDQTF